MSKKRGETKQGEKTYQIRPLFKDKSRPQEAPEKMEQIVKKKLQGVTFNAQELNNWAKEIADETKVELRALNRDKRYKYLVQCTIGFNQGQGVRIGSRQFWDEDTDDMAFVSYVNESVFCLVVAFAVYFY